MITRNLLAMLLIAWPDPEMRAGEVTTTYEITLNGQKFNVNTESATNVIVNGMTLKLSARENPEKTFSDGNIAFNFPATHAVSKEIEDEVTTWTLDGQDNILILLKMTGVDPADVGKETIRNLKRQYGTKSKLSDCKLALGGEMFSGKKITATLAGATISQEVYELKAGSDGYLLLVQDSGETESAETRTAKALLKQSFKRTAVSEAETAK